MKARSLLYTSAIRPERFGHLAASGAHVGVIDLEDGVPSRAREEARGHLATYLSRGDHGLRRAVRVNPMDSVDGLRDMLFLSSLDAWPDILVMSMVPGESHLEILRKLLDEMRPDAHPGILVTIERPEAIANARAIARLADGLIFGSADYCASMGMSIGSGEKLKYARCTIANAAACHGIPAYDTACFDIGSISALEDESEAAKELGFHGKTAVHPNQIAVINRIFSPSADEIEKARKLILAYEEAGMGIVRGEGGMVGPPFYKAARKIVEA